MSLVTVKTFDNYFLANIAFTQLQAAGVACYLKDENTVAIDPILSNAIGGIKLQVNKIDEAEVVALMTQLEEDFLKSLVCPTCGTNEIEQVFKPGPANFITAILTWLFTSYAIAPVKVYHCKGCGYESQRLPENENA